MAFYLKSTSPARETNPNIKFVTKTFDMEDVSIEKKFSLCKVSYKIEDNGISKIKVYYKLNNLVWKPFHDEPKSFYSSDNKLLRTNNKIQTASFRFPDNTKGRTIAIKIEYVKDSDSDGIEGFELSDISFTYRAINRK
jgi:hypothetical protein